MKRVILPILIISTLLLTTACTKLPPGEKETIAVHADYPWYQSVGELFDRADLVIEGTVLDSRVEWMNHAIYPEEDKDDPRLNPGGDRDPGEMITTVYTVEVHDIYKGSAGETVELEDIGGEIDGIVCENPAAADIDTGVEYLMFLSVYEDFPACLLNPVQAIYRVDGDSLVGAMPLTYEDLAYLQGLSYTSIPTIQGLSAEDVAEIVEYNDSVSPDTPARGMEDPGDIQSCLDRLKGIRLTGKPEEDWPDPQFIAPGDWSHYAIHCRDGQIIDIHFLMDRVDFGEGYYPYERKD